MNAKEWLQKGSHHYVLTRQIFVIDSAQGKPTDKPVLCILHGFPTSSYDYWKVLDKLSQTFRVIIHDHLGFGYSDKPLEYSYSLIDQTDIALTLWKQLGIEKAYLLAHDYGTSILTEILARDNQKWCPIQIQKVALCNGSMHIEMAKLKLVQKLLRRKYLGPLVAKLVSKNILEKTLKEIYVKPSELSSEEIDAIWEISNYNNGKRVLAKVSQYTLERTHFWHRWIGALQDTELRLEMIWADSDPIAVPEIAKVILGETQNSGLYWLEGVGHFPMLEAPDLWCDAVTRQLLKST